MYSRKAIVVITCSALTVLVSMGIRQSFGIFQVPLTQHLNIGREAFSLAIAWQNLIFGLPLVGIVADRFGPRWVILVSGFLFGTSLLVVPMLTSTIGLYLTLGLWGGVSLSGITYVVVLGAVAQVVPAERRSTAFGIITAASSFGMFIMVLVTGWFLDNFGWQNSLYLLGTFAGVIVLLSFGLPAKPAQSPTMSGSDSFEKDSLPAIFLKARRHSGYWLLNAGFFVCGFHVAFIATHLPAFLGDNAVSPGFAATALALIGVANIFGSYSFGVMGDRYRKKHLLSFLYFARAVVISLFILIPISNGSALIFGGTIGFLWLATVPLTSGMVAQIFGSRYLSTLYGVVFLSHQIGAFLGVWLGGRVYDATGTYTSVWLAAIILSVISGLLHLPITDTPIVDQPEPVLAEAA